MKNAWIAACPGPYAGLDRRAHEVDGVRNVLDRLPSRELADRVPMDNGFVDRQEKLFIVVAES